MEFETLLNNIHLMDCLDGHKFIPDNSVDLIYSDLPYNQTKNIWDELVPLDQLWADYKRIIKPNGAIVLHAQGAFTSMLMQSNKKMWRYNLVWKKGERISGHLNAKRMPLRNHEDVAVFYDPECEDWEEWENEDNIEHEDIAVFYKRLPTYNPQFTEGIPLHSMGHAYKTAQRTNNNYGKFKPGKDNRAGTTQKYPKSVLNFERPHPPIHPTQKPVPLAEWIISTYSNPGDIVLDSTGGIGTSVKAARNLKRIPISFEKTEKFYTLAQKFINN